MADNLQTAPGSGSDPFVATDQLPDGSHAQKIKLIDGTADGATPAAVTAAGALKVDGSAVTQPVAFAGGVTVVQPAAAELNATVTGTVTANAGSGPWPVTDNGGALTVDGTVTVQDGGGAVSIDDNGASLTVDGTVTANQGGSNWSVNQTMLGGAAVDTGGGNKSAGTQRVVIATDQPQLANALKVDGSAVTQPVSGNVGLAPQTSGGLSAARTISAAGTNAASVKASAGQVFGIYAHNVNAAVRYLKLYNKASAPAVGTDTPVLTLPIPGNAAGAGFVLEQANGIAFGTGIALALTTGVADSDTGAVAANEIVVSLLYK